MHAVHNDQPIHQRGLEHRQTIGHRRAPIVAQHGDGRADLANQRGHVAHQFRGLVIARILRCPALAKAALVGGDQAVFGQVGGQLGPGPAIFGKAVQRQDGGRVGRPPFADVEPVAVQLDGIVAHHCPCFSVSNRRPAAVRGSNPAQ